jgi:hypothetical protein
MRQLAGFSLGERAQTLATKAASRGRISTVGVRLRVHIQYRSVLEWHIHRERVCFVQRRVGGADVSACESISTVELRTI